jgi:U3 small nucleolar RNA-associated protein 24
MGRAKKTRKFAQVKRIIGRRHIEAQSLQSKRPNPSKKQGNTVTRIPQVSSSLFFAHNDALVPPYDILVDSKLLVHTMLQIHSNNVAANFLSHTVQHKLDLLPSLMDLLYAQCNINITDCVSLLPT